MAETNTTRRSVLKLGASLPAAAAVLPIALGSETAQAKTPKEAAQYQAEPKNGQKCNGCQFWIEADGDMGKCRIVKGKIHPKGWCNLYAAA